VTEAKGDDGVDSTVGGTSINSIFHSVQTGCNACGLCVKECAFLKKHGNPRDIAVKHNPSAGDGEVVAFECSLCGLCTALCPKGVDPSAFFLEMRREAVRNGRGRFPEHAAALAYERRGMSSAYSYYGLPAGCDTVFFPGCALAGSRSEAVIRTYERLRATMPTLGVVLDCCGKISHDLGREEDFASSFGEMRRYLVSQNIGTVLTGCPNCHKMFREYGEGLLVASIYEILARSIAVEQDEIGGKKKRVTMHDPCGARFEREIGDSVRGLVLGTGTAIEEMEHSARITLCCGEGGSVGALAPGLLTTWAEMQRQERAGRVTVTYCAGCASRLGADTVHVLDLVAGEPGEVLPVAKPPRTYWKRLRLKSWFKNNVPAAVRWERPPRGEGKKKSGGKLITLLFLLAVAIVVVRTTGVTRFLDQQVLQNWIAGYGSFAPLVYIASYTLAPVLFLPGLPFTVVGGLLFGPLWGVVYAILGATAGASLAFLVPRYFARGWVEARLRGPRWKKLDEGVQNHGWKVVAFTRLVPVFPFNLLNYAFGLTKIRFWQYVIVSLICMLPACIAYIVFSSSLFDLIKGRVTVGSMLGAALIVAVSLIPVLYRRHRAKKGGKGPL
jgi:uncharacterized membrane protein YdjX (TVP38/TMEM64 family)/Fe-S oxidoreductase